MKEITIGLTNQTDVEITSGLKDGDTAYVQLPNVSTSTTSSTSKTSGGSGASSFGGGSGSYGGGSGSGAGGGR
jgi:HlyD family secretion protein